MNTLYKVVKIEGKDLGCVAIKDIKKGEFYQVRFEKKKSTHVQKLAINKKSTIFFQSSLNLVKLIAS